MTATSQASDAAERLREIVKPGGTVYAALRGTTRSGVEKVRLYAADHTPITDLAVDVLRNWVRLVPGTGCIALSPAYNLGALLDRLSIALFGETGLIKGEYL